VAKLPSPVANTATGGTNPYAKAGLMLPVRGSRVGRRHSRRASRR
jgi:hypothetical protein